MSTKITCPNKTKGTVWAASFDIGKKNFCFYIEEFTETEIVGPMVRYNVDGTPTVDMQNTIDQVCMNGTTILHLNSDITQNCDPKMKLDPESYYNMIDLLDKYSKWWEQCDYVIIEEQMKKLNTMAVKLGQHCFSYFAVNYGRALKIIEFPAYHKTQVLGAAKIKGKMYKNGNFKWSTMDKPQRKKWNIQAGIEILSLRDENDIISNIKTVAKKDDLCDTLCQLQAWKILNALAPRATPSLRLSCDYVC
jgi:hypothetical protein